MNYLIDSHTLIWALFNEQKVSVRARSILVNSSNDIHVSHVSFWEISLKHSLGKLDLKGTHPQDLPNWCEKTNFKIFSLTENDVCTFHTLPPSLHKDPFDRMLAWQAINRHYLLLSKDHALTVYQPWELQVVW